MKLLDANILLYAYDSSATHHAVCRDWLERIFNEPEPIGLPWQTLLAFIRISTNPRAVRRPLAAEEACSIVESWLSRPQTVIPEPGGRYWALLGAQIRTAKASGPLVTDAALAALALEQGATLCSTDRDFRRFDGIKLFDPTQTR